MSHTLAGLAIVLAHAIGFIVFAPTCTRVELTVELTPRGPEPSLATATLGSDGGAPGLRYTRWTARYRGGFERSVGWAELAGSRQDPAARACVGRVVVGQRLLDDGHAGPGTIAHEMARAFDAELRGESYFPIGDYRRVERLSVRWAQLAAHADDLLMIGGAPHGYVRVTATLVFDRVAVPLIVALIPSVAATSHQLAFRIVARAGLAFDNRFVQWASDKLGGDRLATRLARRQIDDTLASALAPPPPFELGDGQQLVFGYCGGLPHIVEGESGALPFSIALGTAAGVLPTRHGPAPHAAITLATTLAIDLDLDALNAVLFELWRTNFLDRRLADAGLDTRFNGDAMVQEFLSLRISAPRLAHPPVVSATARGGLALHADARLELDPGGGAAATVGRVWGGLDFTFAPATVEPMGVSLGALELTCERGPSTLVPCYADLVAALRDRGAQFHGELTRTFGKLVRAIFVDRRLATSGLPAELVIRGAVPSVVPVGGTANASLHLELDAAIEGR